MTKLEQCVRLMAEIGSGDIRMEFNTGANGIGEKGHFYVFASGDGGELANTSATTLDAAIDEMHTKLREHVGHLRDVIDSFEGDK